MHASRSVYTAACGIVSIQSADRRAVGLPFPPQSYDSPVTLVISLLLNLGRERDGAHDAISELLVQNGLVGVPVVLYNLEEAVDQRLFGRHIDCSAPVRPASHLRLKLVLGDVQELGQVLDVVRAGLGLAVKKRRNGDLFAAELLGDGFEGQVLLLLGLEEGRRGRRETMDEGGLRGVSGRSVG